MNSKVPRCPCIAPSQHPVEHEQPGIVVPEPGSDEGGGTAAPGDAGDPEASAGTSLEQAEEDRDENEL